MSDYQQLVGLFKEIKELLSGKEYSITRIDGKGIDLPEAIRIGDIFERCDKILSTNSGVNLTDGMSYVKNSNEILPRPEQVGDIVNFKDGAAYMETTFTGIDRSQANPNFFGSYPKKGE